MTSLRALVAAATPRVPLLLEREVERVRLRALLDAAATGEGALASVVGSAGLGKSTLLAETQREAEQRGFRVLSARGHALERGMPFGAVLQLFSAVAHEPKLLTGPAALARPLLERAHGVSPPGNPDAAFPLLHGLHWLVIHLSERQPLLLLLDDAQWADDATLRYLHYLGERLEELPAAIVIAVRTGESLEAETGALLSELQRASRAVQLALRPLGPASIERIVRAAFRDATAELIAACAEATRGNPFLLRELLGAALREGVLDPSRVRALRPDSIRDWIVARLARLGPEPETLARAAAVLRPGARPDLVLQLSGLDGDTGTATADRLVEADILSTDGGVDFAHPIIRDAVYEGIAPLRRRAWHRAAAELLRAQGLPAAEVASHLLRCDPVGDAWAVDCLVDAAREAARSGGAPEAVRFLRRALEEPGASARAELLLELGAAESMAGDRAGLDRLEAAVAAAGNGELRLTAEATLGMARHQAGEGERALEMLGGILGRIPPGTGGVLEAQILSMVHFASRFVPSRLQTLDLERARHGPSGEVTPAEFARRCCLAYEGVLAGRPVEAVGHARGALAMLEESSELMEMGAYNLLYAVLTLGLAGHFSEAAQAMGSAIESARRAGDRFSLGAALEVRGAVHAWSGSLRPALADLDATYEICDLFPLSSLTTRVFRAEILLERGQRREAEEALAGAARLEPELSAAGIVFGRYWLWHGQAVFALSRRDWKCALEVARRLGTWLEKAAADCPALFPWRSLAARACHGLGDQDASLALARGEVDLARRAGACHVTGRALTTLGRLQGGEPGIESLREAVELLEASEAKLELARARLALGTALRQAGRRREARGQLGDALHGSHTLGANLTAQAALAELRLAGGRPRRLVQSGLDALTPAQHRVAELAASGLSNREIAATLFVTLRTVESHLTETYQKLGIVSRDQLAAALRDG